MKLSVLEKLESFYSNKMDNYAGFSQVQETSGNPVWT